MKCILILFVAFAGIAEAQSFKPVLTIGWSGATVNGCVTLKNGDIFVYGDGQFLFAPAPLNGCIVSNGKSYALPWKIPRNIYSVVETNDGIIYTGGALGLGKIQDGVHSLLVESTGFLYSICLYQNSLYFGGTLGSIDNNEANFARYDLSTGEITTKILPGTVRGIVPFASAGEDTSLYVLTSERNASFFKYDKYLNPLSMSQGEDDPKYYIGVSMSIWQEKLVLICWGNQDDGYLATYDKYEWEFSPNIDIPRCIAISPNEELFVTGTIFNDTGASIVSEFSTVAEWSELSDENGRIVQSTTYGARVYIAWSGESQYVVMNSGTWIQNYAHSYHIFRLDSIESNESSEIVVYPNPSSGDFTVKVPVRFSGMLKLFDLSGRLVHSEIVIGKIFPVSIKIEEGIYILQCGNYVVKIIVMN